MSTSEDKEFDLFLEAIRESYDNGDVQELKSEVQIFQNELMRVKKKLNESLANQKKQAQVIEKLNKERIRLKKELIEVSFQRKSGDHQLNLMIEKVKGLKSELKSKSGLMVEIEKERKKLERDFSKWDTSRASREKREGTAASDSKTSALRHNQRSISAERGLDDKRHEYSKQLLKNGMTAAYSAGNDLETDHLEKVVLLQRMLLSKNREVAARDVKIEQLDRNVWEMSQQVHRLRRAKQYAEELTSIRHKLNLKTTQLEALKSELVRYKYEASQQKAEIAKLKDKLKMAYKENQ